MADFLRSIAVAAQGLRAQAGRMRLIAENIANAESTPSRPGEEPYRRKIAVFDRRFDAELGVTAPALGRTKRDARPFPVRHEPGHPAADAAGNVRAANVEMLVESMDMREAQRSYEANVNVIATTRRMIQRTLDLLRT
jgi:flagellar basal-body rod protein FlgC